MRRRGIISILILALICAACLSIFFGPSGLGFKTAVRALFEGEGGVYVVVMREIRLPRVLLSILIGFALGISGAAMQGFLRNPLAEPGVLGISTASALGAVIALQTGFALEGMNLSERVGHGEMSPIFKLPISAMLGAVVAAMLLFLFAQGTKSESLILVGIGISSLAGALTSLLLNISPNPFAAAEIMFWMMGSVSDRSMIHFWMILPFILTGAGIIFAQGSKLDALALGEDTAQSMGISLNRLATMLIIAVTMMVGATVAVAGAIGFVGLVVPHMLRPFVGTKPSHLLFASGLGGATLLTIADILTRIIAPDRDLKLGVLTALIGAPVFLHLVIRTNRRRI